MKRAAWSWDKAGSQCVIRVPAAAATEMISIEM
jgi:hypothetical protein